MSTVIQDLRHAFRSLLRRPAFTAAAALSLALGIGANSTVFTLVKALFLKPLAVSEPERLVSVFTEDEKNPETLHSISWLNSRDLVEQNETLIGLANYVYTVFDVDFGGGEEVRLLGQAVGGEYFDVLGIAAERGRTLAPGDAPAPEQGERVAVVSHGFWVRRLGADPEAVGRPLTVNRQAFTLVGVMPRGFTGEEKSVEPEIWVPATLLQQLIPSWVADGGTFTSRRGLLWSAVARLAPGVTIEQAEANLRVIGDRLEEQYPAANRGRSFRLISLGEANLDPSPEGRARLRLAMGLLMGLVGLVLLIACANIANLLLVRASGRRREVAIRLSLGSTRSRLVSRYLAESVVLAGFGGVLSLAVALVGQKLLATAWPPSLVVRSYDFTIDGWVLSFTFGVTVLSALLFGLLPALKASRADVVRELKDLPAGAGGRRFTTANLLVIGQVALTLVALVAAGLFVRSLAALRGVEPGFDADRLAFSAFDLSAAGYDHPRAEVFHRELVERAAALPGATAAAVSDLMPFAGGGFGRTVFLEGEEEGSGEGGRIVYCGAVGPGFFKTLGLPLHQGRVLDASDGSETPKVVVVNETMAKRFWGDEDPVGRRFHFYGKEEWRTVVGVVGDSKFFRLNEAPEAVAWYPISQMPSLSAYLLVRADGDPAPLVGAVRELLRELEPGLPRGFADTLPARIEESLFQARLISRLLAIFGALALILALVGLFGVVSYSVALRHREIGIRMAVGARRGDVLWLVLGQGLALVAAGLVSGLLAAWAGGRLLEGYLFGIRPTDLVTLAGAPLLLLTVAVGAILLPARRAATVDPVRALKYE